MSKKAVEKQEIENVVEKNKKSFKPLFWLILLGFIGGSGYYVWNNFDHIKSKIPAFYSEKNEVSDDEKTQEPDWFSMIEEKADKASVYTLQEKIMNLQSIVSELTMRQNGAADVANLNSRIDNLQDLLIASVNGKADAQAVLGLIVRLDKLENETNRLSKLNNEGAIMLAVATLIKERASEGKDFSFEATMLSELAAENKKIAKPLKIIEKSAVKGIVSNQKLALEFDEIYKKLNVKEPEHKVTQNWKDRVIAKLRELVVINSKEEKQAAEEQDNFMTAIRELADNQQFGQIAVLINDNHGDYLKKNPALRKWIKKVQEKENFEAAISKISAYCLVLMKINNLLTKEQ